MTHIVSYDIPKLYNIKSTISKIIYDDPPIWHPKLNKLKTCLPVFDKKFIIETVPVLNLCIFSCISKEIYYVVSYKCFTVTVMRSVEYCSERNLNTF